MEWQRCFRLVRLHLEAGGTLPTAPGDIVHQGEDLGRWVRSVRLGWDGLTTVQQWLCQVLGITPAASDEKPRRPGEPTGKRRGLDIGRPPEHDLRRILDARGAPPSFWRQLRFLPRRKR
ncbi:hypothetical protein ACFYN5_35860 [Streptomyces sp. NPDC007126]|uniref:hypothetical protein n=1 Tax=Streptomyces sp. NPDC007126 TaxID=3364774 RepID=UPI0036CD590F